MGVLEKFIDLVKIDSPSDPASPTCPSTAMQLDVANHLERVMKEMGISNVRQQDGYASTLKSYRAVNVVYPGCRSSP